MNEKTWRFWVLWFAGAIIAVVLGILQYGNGHTGFFVAWIAFYVVMSTPIWWSIFRRRQCFEPGELTGSRIDVVDAGPPNTWVGSRGTPPVTGSWTGGAIVPGPLGRTYASAPLAVLSVAAGRVTLRLRPRIIVEVCGAHGFTATPSDIDLIFPVKGWVSKGVGLARPDSPVVYFGTSQRTAVLSALAAAGFKVSPQERRYRY